MIDTKLWMLDDPESASADPVGEAAEMLRSGGLVAFPTETVYGLGADARSSEAVAGIFKAKGRPSDNPLIVHIASVSQLDGLVLPYPKLAEELMERFWPGPLTLVLPVVPDALSPLVTAGLPTVGVRMPDHQVALELLSRAGCPVAAPSANKSGRPSPTLASHVVEDLRGFIDGVLDGGATGVGLESTVIELEDEHTIRILRPGGVTEEAFRQACPDIGVIGAGEQEDAALQPRSPGMKYTHYAPKGELTVVQGEPGDIPAYVNPLAEAAKLRGELTGVLAFSERVHAYNADLVLDLGSESKLDEAARRLYALLRRFDDAGINRIWSEACSDEGLGGALMNRMQKAAGGRVIRIDK
ncbi:threonylcarbamoyl-AMP synthase [Paenibacillus nanensis]|uniref:Threonylcarbamoyl-AMP synthase n=1 Tax=Paenibacillus nanensis TaxID=393251 RepID=A0A3A1UUZ4_9BACL|nr:L-threonylcarbamoyladenylate synthase [Paenibacillus nanensis]RIX50992.1 threonylcarbamoyl-AMP synthase [Paenibacillus nanensis]